MTIAHAFKCKSTIYLKTLSYQEQKVAEGGESGPQKI